MIARSHRTIGEAEGLSSLDASITQVLSTREERDLLNALAECRDKLADALKILPGADASHAESVAHYVASLKSADGPVTASLGAVARRYDELRSKLALANMRLVAHVAKKFRDRGIAYSDLLQEGFCGLLEAIDRFDLTRETKLATYATWWIRQAMQREVAAGAYPVRLSPRHLRQLAQNQGDAERGTEIANCPSDTIRKIHAATRPTVSLDAPRDSERGFTLLQTMSDIDGDGPSDSETDEAVINLMGALRPREQQVLEFRYGLAGKPRLSLSQVGKVMAVSKERVRQIQDRALTKLREAAGSTGFLEDALLA